MAVNTWDSSGISHTSVYGGHISSDWDVSQVTNMSNLFEDKTSFNEDISGWDVSNVTKMFSMFKGATSFNKPLNNWNVSNVTSYE